MTMSNELLSYREINEMFGNRKFGNYVTEMFGNTFYVYEIEKKKFKKPKKCICVCLVCCCGIHKQTMIDILKSFNFDLSDIEKGR